MPVTHAWQKTVLAPARLDRGTPEVRWWPHCGTYGAQVAVSGKTLLYRATAIEEWVAVEPSCAAPPKRSGA